MRKGSRESGSREERRMSDGPKLYTNKPKKGQLKAKAKELSSSPTNLSLSSAPSMGSTPPPPSSSPPPPPPPPPSLPKESFARRYKFLWPLLLTVNLAIGAYLFVRTNGKEKGKESDEVADETSTASASSTAPFAEKPSSLPATAEPKKVRPPVPENEQRQLFKWMLEEKRKVKPETPSEKKRIDEEKAILKQFIRAKSIPSL